MQLVHGKSGMLKILSQHIGILFVYYLLLHLLSSIIWGYDTELQLTGIANEDGELYRFGLDGRGDVVDEWGFDGLHRHYERDGAGRVSKVLRPDERWSSYEYDGTGHIVSEQHSDGSESAYKYNKDGLLVAVFNDATRIGLVRGRDGRVLKETQGEHRVESHYDAYGSRIRLCSDMGADVALQYDTEGQLSGMQASDWSVEIGRDKSGLEIQRELSGGVRITTERDQLGRVTEQGIFSNNVEKGRMRFHWDMGNRLLRKTNLLTGESVHFDYDPWDNLFKADYKEGSQAETIYKAPDAIGNLFRTPERKDRKYGNGGRLLEDKEFSYHYDGEGNLVMKTRRGPSEAESKPGKKRKNWFGLLFSSEDADADGKSRETDPFEEWQPGDTCYGWQANGMLAAVRTPEGKMVTFGYDALGRRVSKSVGNGTWRFGWDGNVVLHEWDVDEAGKPKIVTDATGREEYNGTEKPENLVTWVYDGTSFTPVAKVANGERYTIVQDYLGTPTQAYDSRGELVWEMLLDMYGKVTECHGDSSIVPFRYQGQYEDSETGLYYNRFRYYDCNTGSYISQDPIGLAGNNPTLYGYVYDNNTEIDPLGLMILPDGVQLVKDVPNPKKTILLGENMAERVIPVANKNGYSVFKPRGKNPKYWMRNQQQWIRRQLKDPKVRILDLGPDPNRTIRSKYYLEEMKYAKKYAGYERKQTIKKGCH